MTAPRSARRDNLQLPGDTLAQLYQTMRRVRRFDQRVAELFESGEVKGTAHSYVGEEAVARRSVYGLNPAVEEPGLLPNTSSGHLASRPRGVPRA